MHQGKELREIAEKQKHIGKFAKQIGISRDTLYQLFKKQSIHPKHLEKLRTMGISLTASDNTKYYATKGHPLLRVGSATNGKSKHITKSDISERNLTPPNSISVASLISLSLDELLKLQQDQDDPELLKTVNLVIQMKKDIEHLEKDNKKLERDNEFLKEMLKQKK